MDTCKDFDEKKKKLLEEFNSSNEVFLGKKTSNLFRNRNVRTVESKRINVRNFNKVLSIDEKNLVADVEGMITYEDLVNETLKYGLMPTVVPQLKSITIGGAVSGLGIEASSFKFGLVHETVTELEVLTGNGEIIVCNSKQNKDLFYGFPNSYGTFGYILRLKVKLVRVKPFVKITHKRFSDAKEYFKEVEKLCKLKKDIDFIDGTVFNENEMYITTGEFVDVAPFVSNYKGMKIYYRSIQKKKVDYLKVKDFIWRWDTDWFWCSKNFGVQNPFLRLFTMAWLNSKTYWKVMNLSAKTGLTNNVNKILKRKVEGVIQDVEIPVERSAEFLRFFSNEIGISPVWICPTKIYDPKIKNDLYIMDSKKLYINFGFWEVIPTTHEDGYYNKKIEFMVEKLKGKKSLYSTAFYDEKKFWELYNKKDYDRIKNKYDSRHKLKNLYEKVVLRR